MATHGSCCAGYYVKGSEDCAATKINDAKGTGHRLNCRFVEQGEAALAHDNGCKYILVEVTHDISADSELFASYGPGYWPAEDAATSSTGAMESTGVTQDMDNNEDEDDDEARYKNATVVTN
jgi:hypothetical protein